MFLTRKTNNNCIKINIEFYYNYNLRLNINGEINIKLMWRIHLNIDKNMMKVE